MSKFYYKSSWEPSLQVKRQTEELPRGKAGKRKMKMCKRLKGEHRYIFFQLLYRNWIDLRCRGCGKKAYIIRPNPTENLSYFRKTQYDKDDLEFIEKFEGDKSIFNFDNAPTNKSVLET